MTLGDILSETWSVFVRRLALNWATFFATVIPMVLLLLVLVVTGGLGAMVYLMVHHLPTAPGATVPLAAPAVSAGSLVVALVSSLVIYLLVLPYAFGGWAGTVMEALDPNRSVSALDFFTNGARYYGRTWGFILLLLVVGVLWFLVAILGTLILGHIFFLLAFLWMLALGLALSCLMFYWVPAVYLGQQGQLAALASALNITFAQGGWMRAIGFVLLCFVAGLVIEVVGAILAMILIGFLVLIVGMVFLDTFYLLGAFVAYQGSQQRSAASNVPTLGA
ncbi:MAG: hypothetical protein M0Z27_05660 [Thermaerobacter sp.]|nr:hypothetical protein [Thermaerobacter sp.]